MAQRREREEKRERGGRGEGPRHLAYLLPPSASLALWGYKCSLNSNLLVARTPQFTTLSITNPFWRLPTTPLGKGHSHFREQESEAWGACTLDARSWRELETAEARNSFHSSLPLLIPEPTGTLIN